MTPASVQDVFLPVHVRQGNSLLRLSCPCRRQPIALHLLFPSLARFNLLSLITITRNCSRSCLRSVLRSLAPMLLLPLKFLASFLSRFNPLMSYLISSAFTTTKLVLAWPAYCIFLHPLIPLLYHSRHPNCTLPPLSLTHSLLSRPNCFPDPHITKLIVIDLLPYIAVYYPLGCEGYKKTKGFYGRIVIFDACSIYV